MPFSSLSSGLTAAPSAVVIEVSGAAAGIVAADGARFRFHAASPRFQPLDGQIFRTPGDAERAVRRVIASRRPTPVQASLQGQASLKEAHR